MRVRVRLVTRSAAMDRRTVSWAVRRETYPAYVSDERLNAIAAELSRIEEAAMYSAQTQFSSGKFWRGLHFAIGVPTAATAAIAGASGLADTASTKTVAVVALIAAALTAVMTTLNAAQRAEQSRISANAYLTLQGDARVLRTIDLPAMSVDDARTGLHELVAQRNTLNEGAPVPAFLAYLFGSRNIGKGRQTYDLDKGTS